MSKFLYTSVCCAVIFCLGSWECFAASDSVNIVKDGQGVCSIASPSAQKPGIPFAIQELKKYVEQMSGAKLADGDAKSSPAIVVGLRSDFSPEDQAALPPAAKGYDGYAVAVVAEPSPKILIAGDNERGAIYGVYDVLERLGCRWFYPTQDPKDPEVVPHSASLAIAVGKSSVASPMRFRIYNGDAWYFDMHLADAMKQVDHAMKLRSNVIGWQAAVDKPLADQYRTFRDHGVLAEIEKRDMGFHGPAHSFNHFLPNEHFAKHPKWFGMRDGKRVPQAAAGAQFCWSNADARKVFVENVAAFVQSAPLLRILAIVPFDGGKACTCPECTKAGPSNCLLVVMNEVIERLHSFRPDLLVETVGGYAPMIEPPDRRQGQSDSAYLLGPLGTLHGLRL